MIKLSGNYWNEILLIFWIDEWLIKAFKLEEARCYVDCVSKVLKLLIQARVRLVPTCNP